MTTLYGIPNCDSVKKAKKWLEKQGIDYNFYDFRKDGLTAKQVKQWIGQIGLEKLVNKRSTTWKGLSDSQQASLSSSPNEKAAIALIVDNPTLIKRPLLETAKQTNVGFNEAQYLALFS